MPNRSVDFMLARHGQELSGQGTILLITGIVLLLGSSACAGNTIHAIEPG